MDFQLPALAALVMSPIHCLFGLHIVRRGVIFIDLAVAQMAALGMAIAVASGQEVNSPTSYWLSLAFALGAAIAIALTRFRLGRVPHEAIIGVIFVVASALGIVVLDKSPHGIEELREILSGSILFVNAEEVKHTGIIYGIILLITLAVWRKTTAVTLSESNAPTGFWRALLDFGFYGLLAFVVASSVKIAGVLVVFTWLVMPAVVAFFYVEKMFKALLLAMPVAILGSALGIWTSFRFDWPTGPAIVVAFGALVAVAYLFKLLLPARFWPEVSN